MGICFSRKSTRSTRIYSKRISNQSSTTSINKNSLNRWSRVRSSSVKKEKFDDALLHEQAIAAALLFQQHQQQNGAFDRSISLRHPSGGSNSKCHQGIPRSSSTRRRSLADPMLPLQQLINQVCYLFIDWIIWLVLLDWWIRSSIYTFCDNSIVVSRIGEN